MPSTAVGKISMIMWSIMCPILMKPMTREDRVMGALQSTCCRRALHRSSAITRTANDRRETDKEHRSDRLPGHRAATGWNGEGLFGRVLDRATLPSPRPADLGHLRRDDADRRPRHLGGSAQPSLMDSGRNRARNPH